MGKVPAQTEVAGLVTSTAGAVFVLLTVKLELTASMPSLGLVQRSLQSNVTNTLYSPNCKLVFAVSILQVSPALQFVSSFCFSDLSFKTFQLILVFS